MRKATIRAIAELPLKFSTCIEPIDVEHTDEEIAERIAFAAMQRPYELGVMPRIPASGTPLGTLPMLGRERLCHIFSVVRLAANSTYRYVGIYPDEVTGMEPGSNRFTIERGAIPRDTEFSEREWKGFSADRALAMAHDAGFSTTGLKGDPRFC